MKQRVAVGALTLAAVGAAAAVSLGQNGSDGIKPTGRDVIQLRADAQTDPPASAAAVARTSALKKVKWFDSPVFEVPPEGVFTSLKCPKKSPAAVNGYFATEGGVVLDHSNVGVSTRKWEFGLLNLTGEVAGALVGIVCVK